MPQEPKRRHSKARKRTRRAAIFLKAKSLIACQNCGGVTLPHQVCKSCGFYRAKKVQDKVDVKVTKA